MISSFDNEVLTNIRESLWGSLFMPENVYRESELLKA